MQASSLPIELETLRRNVIESVSIDKDVKASKENEQNVLNSLKCALGRITPDVGIRMDYISRRQKVKNSSETSNDLDVDSDNDANLAGKRSFTL